LEEADVLEVLDSYTAELTEEALEQLTALSEPEDEADSNAVVERSQLTASALKRPPEERYLS
jgi:hypothetical protein